MVCVGGQQVLYTITGWQHRWIKTVDNFHKSWSSQEVIHDKIILKAGQTQDISEGKRSCGV